jgi:Icc-related predicted phosphoesterase
MKIRLWSDIHNEFGPLTVKTREDDKETVLVIAGDFDVGAKDDTFVVLLKLCHQFKAVVFVCGNHEYYHNIINDVDKRYREFSDEVDNFHFLQGDYAIIDDVRFIGGTFWTDFNRADDDVMNFCQHRMNDYNYIRYQGPEDVIYRRFTPDDAWYINHKQRALFAKFLDQKFDGKTIVVTHHAPTSHSIDPAYKHHSSDQILNYAYRNTGLEETFFKDKEFWGWFHGHIHKRQEHDVFGKKIIANPRGYIGHEMMAYNLEDDKVIEV